MLSKFHKTTSECRQRTSGTQKSSPLSSKGGRKNIKDKKTNKNKSNIQDLWDNIKQKKKKPWWLRQ